MITNAQYLVYEVIEGSLKAEKSLNIFGGPNMWYLYAETKSGAYKLVQAMHVTKIQEFFESELPVYEEK